jgi:hypothetical protein
MRFIKNKFELYNRKNKNRTLIYAGLADKKIRIRKNAGIFDFSLKSIPIYRDFKSVFKSTIEYENLCKSA